MVADIALKVRRPVTPEDKFADIRGDNDNEPLLTYQDVHPLALEAAKRLISNHSEKTPVVIKSWGTPDIVYDELRTSLIAFGYRIDMAEDMAERLVDHALDHADQSRAKLGDPKIIALKLEVSKAKPEAQFETGALEVQRIDGQTNQAQVAGATSIAMGINTGGTFTTALRDSVGEILQLIAGANNAVWIHFEAPDKSELKGIANEAALAAVADIAGGALSPEQVQELLQQINMLVDAGLIAPEIVNALQALNQIQIQAAAGNLDGIKELSQSIIDGLRDAMNGDNPPRTEILQALAEAMQLVSDKYGLQSIMGEVGLSLFQQEVLTKAVIEKLQEQGLSTLADGLEGLEGEALHKKLDEINQILKEMGIDMPEIAQLQNLVIQNMPLDQRIEFLAELQAQKLMDLIAELGGIKNLPPEIAALLEGMENVTLEQLKEALAGRGDPALIEAVQNFVVQIQNPSIQALMPEGVANSVNQFLSGSSQLVEAVTAKAAQ